MADRDSSASIRRVELVAATPSQAVEARHILRRRLDGWECERTDDAVLVFAELVANALKHADGATAILVVHGTHTLRLEVHDNNHSVPQARAGSESGGFGLRIIGQVSQQWGWEQTADGKVVWCDMPCCPTDARTSD